MTLTKPGFTRCTLLASLLIATPLTALESTSGSQANKAQLLNVQANQSALELIRDQKKGSYAVRTEHLNDNGSPKYVNQLINEESPYLLQHAHNPVQWHAWSDEAFALAEAQNKPVFLSIGYSTCHWCHVMEVESFDNEAIASYLNKHFICIKVDREQRPDIDEIYMTGVQIFTGRGGWPMSSFLTPQGQPFFGGTYFPPHDFQQLLERVVSAWQNKEPQLRKDAQRVTLEIEKRTSRAMASASVDQTFIEKTKDQLIKRWDQGQGGFGSAPKFPNEPLLLLMTDQLKRHDNPKLLKALEHSLRKMAQGGIFDQIAGGFHRYSTDDYWLAPHFEKMLYNQALLARAYSDTYLITGKPFYKHISEQTIDYVLRDMREPDGGFFSATDADSEGEEGIFFIWQQTEIEQLLSPADAQLIIELYGVSKAGNFEGRNILHLPTSTQDFAAAHKLKHEDLLQRLTIIKQLLYQAREKREHPIRDEKIITAWNAMMITAIIEAAASLNRPDYLLAAQNAAKKLWHLHVVEKNKKNPNLKLWRISLANQLSIDASQEDYAYFAEALLALYDATDNKQWLHRAGLITDQMISIYTDPQHGGFFSSASREKGPLIVRIKNINDGAIPSGNSVAIRVLQKLYQRTGKLAYLESLESALAGFSGQIKQYGPAYAYMLTGIADHLNGEVGSTHFFAEGNIRAQLALLPLIDSDQTNSTQHFELSLIIADGWHINSHKPLQKELIATELSCMQENSNNLSNLAIEYPQPEELALGFQAQPLSLFKGKLAIKGSFSATKNSCLRAIDINTDHQLVRLQLKLQACNEQHCLAPEQGLLTLAVP